MMCGSKACVGYFLSGLIAVALFLAFVQPAFAQTAPINRIEEDWTLQIGDPSPEGVAPQVLCLIAPAGNVEGIYATLSLNHGDVPQSVAGGVQLDVWDGATLLASKRLTNQAVLATPDETVRWTTVMRLSPDGLVFEVLNGQSTTWGEFGGENTLKVTIPTSLTHLGNYSPQMSVDHSGVTYAANRVQTLAIERVRAIDTNGLTVEDNNRHVVHSLNE